MNHLKSVILLFLLWTSAIVAEAQIRGVVLDDVTGDSIPFASVAYKGRNVATSCNARGHFHIKKHKGWRLTFSAIGYVTQTINVTEDTPEELVIRLHNEDLELSEVIVKSKKSRYSRKNNPAVELMKKVIAAKKVNKLENKDFYSYDKYEKMTLSINNIAPEALLHGFLARRKYMIDQVEKSPISDKLIMPVSITEQSSKVLYRKDPKKERTIIDGERTEGVNQLIQSGVILNALSADVFSEVDIYDDDIRLLQRTFLSPIANEAIGFYRYYIIDTLKIERDSCIHLTFVPNNQQDMGFSGELYILKDTTYHVKRVSLTIPRNSAVNFIDDMRINQEYERLINGEWVLSLNDMFVEMTINRAMGRYLINRVSKRYNYDFGPIPNTLLRGMEETKRDPDYDLRNEAYWDACRQLPLSKSEANMGRFIREMRTSNGFGIILFAAKAVIENYVETGTENNPSKFDIGPINSMFSFNSSDGFRLRLSGFTTANLNKHVFLSGFLAHGFKSNSNYYRSTLTYSFNEKKYLASEYPQRTISFTSTYDSGSPSDKFATNDKDNVFTSMKWSDASKRMYSNCQNIHFKYETEWGLKLSTKAKVEKNEAIGELLFKPLSDYAMDGINYVGGPWEDYYDADPNSLHNGIMRNTELEFEVEYSPGRIYVNSKQGRVLVNRDATVFTLSHTLGLKGVLGGQYSYNVTEIGLYRRFWLNSWGRMTWNVKAGCQWNQVPYPLLIAPASNLSYIVQHQCFNLINNMEFLNDRYASLMWDWDFAGKILNRIPLIRRLKWRESAGFCLLWGGLSDKNNPNVSANWHSHNLMAFPQGCYIMDTKRPYMEFSVGIHNIFKFFRIIYVHRVNYKYLPTAGKDGFRIGFRMEF